MVNTIKKLIYKSLGEKHYLRTLHRLFFMAYRSGYLKHDPVYKYHYFVKKLILPDDTVIDMGGNLGYFTKIFAGLVPNGHVIAIEPVVPFFKTLQWATKNYKNVTLHNYALGTEEKKIRMSVPKDDGYLRTGLANVAEEEKSVKENYLFDVQMKRASTILSSLPKINYIKCDIEGYEEFVLPEIKNLLEQHKPILQIETWGTHKKVVDDLMFRLGYDKYNLQGKDLKKLPPDGSEFGDYIFIHPENNRLAKPF